MLTEDRSTSTADSLARWFQSFQTNIHIDEDNLRCLTSNSNLQDIWQQIIRHCHPTDFVKKVKETIRINELKERHPDRWEQHKNAQLQQNQIEQRISIRLREIYSARSEQSTNVFNELTRLETLIQDEYSLISSFDKQLQIYQQLLSYFKQLLSFKDKLPLFTSNHRSNHQELLTQLTSTKIGKIEDSTNLVDLCSVLNTLVQQRINQLNKIEKDDQDRSSLLIETYEEALAKANLDFTKQFVHLSNIRNECGKIRQKLEESKREVLSRRSNDEQIQLTSILNTMIANKSIEVHLSLLKKKIQSEIDQTNKSDQKQISRLHQQILDKRYEINKIDQQLNQLIQFNPLETLEKLELKVRDYLRILNDFPSHIHSLNVNHLSLSNDLQSTILNWSNEQFSRIHLINPTIESSPTPLILIPSQTPTTPLTSLKQLLGIKTQDTSILDPILTSDSNQLMKQDYQRWDIDLNEDDIFKIKYPFISTIDWQVVTRVDQQIEQSLDTCKQDFIQYDQFFQNIIKEVRIFQHEHTDKLTFHS